VKISPRLLAISLAVSFALAAAPVAAADPTASSEAALVPVADNTTSGTGLAAASGNPWGCLSRSDLPHFSTHYPNTVSAQGNTICSVDVPRIHVKGTLYRRDCILFICAWSQVDQRSATRTYYYERHVNPSWVCSGNGAHHFKIVTYSEITGWDGLIYAYTTQNESGNLACGS